MMAPRTKFKLFNLKLFSSFPTNFQSVWHSDFVCVFDDVVQFYDWLEREVLIDRAVCQRGGGPRGTSDSCICTLAVMSEEGEHGRGYYSGAPFESWCRACFDRLRDYVFHGAFKAHTDDLPGPDEAEMLWLKKNQHRVPVTPTFISELRRLKLEREEDVSRPEPELTYDVVMTLKDLASSLNVPKELPEALKLHRVRFTSYTPCSLVTLHGCNRLPNHFFASSRFCFAFP
jgi:hypothetical protein